MLEPAERRIAITSRCLWSLPAKAFASKSEAAKAAGEFFKAHAHAGARDRNRGRLRRVGPPPHSRGLGLPRSTQT